MGNRLKRHAGNPLKAVAILRVSTEDQQLGPEAQRAAIMAWAIRSGVEVVAWHLDQGVSGATPVAERPGLLGALGSLRDHSAGILIASKRDRIARDVVIAAMIDRAVQAVGAVLRTADGASDASGPEGALMSGIIDVFAQYERALIRARTRSALAAKMAKGERVGAVRYGHRVGSDGKVLIPDELEQAIVAGVRALRADGLSFRAVRRESAARGLVSRAGKPFTLQAVYAMTRHIAPQHTAGPVCP